MGERIGRVSGEENEGSTPTFEMLVTQITSHWRTNLPAMYGRLTQSGKLDELAGRVATQTQEHARVLIEKSGYDPETAWAEAMREVALSLWT